MSTTISSVTRLGAYEPFGLQVSRNQIQGHTPIIVFGYKDYTTIGSEIYIKCESEYELCVKFLSYWQDHYPDIITGWNSSGYDIPYIINRFNRILYSTL